MDQATRDKLFVYGSAEQFEKWLDDRKSIIDQMLKLPAEQWTKEHAAVAIAVIQSQRTIINAYEIKAQERRERDAAI